MRRFPRPDLVFKVGAHLQIVDYKNVSLDFYYENYKLPLEKTAEKYRLDLIKSLTYEFAIQQTHTVSANIFFIPWYYAAEPQPPLGETEPNLDIKGIKVFKANFFVMQKIYLEESL
jgi:hypothetical protein